ncbi:MAG: excinuclease ABC subunit UvrB, partial [Methylocella sp.]
MAKAPKSASGTRSSRGKAARPEVTPLGKHLAALLNPALNERQPGVSDAAQVRYDHSKPLHHPPGMDGVAATVESLKDLLARGDPNIREKKPWTPHRPPRPDKSEGGQRFRVVSEFEPEGDQPGAIDELVKGIEAQERDQVLLGVTGSGKTFT